MPGGSLHQRWVPMQRKDTDPSFEWNPSLPIQLRSDECWLNDRYQCLVKYLRRTSEPDAQVGPDGMVHLSIHTLDRSPVRNWRHLQQIKNEVCGEIRTGVEIFPPEHMLTDTSNEYHLWVYPEGFELGFGLGEDPVVSDDEVVDEFNDAGHRGHQEPWEPGLTTGRTEHSQASRERLRGLVTDGTATPPAKEPGA